MIHQAETFTGAALALLEQRRSDAHAEESRAERAVLSAMGNEHSTFTFIIEASERLRSAKKEAFVAERLHDYMHDRLWARYQREHPGSAGTQQALQAARQAMRAVLDARAAYEASVTDEQRALQAAVVEAETALATATDAAKAAIAADGSSPSKAFVVKTSNKVAVGDFVSLLSMVAAGRAPDALLKVNDSAIASWVRDADPSNIEFAEITVTPTVSVALHADKLTKEVENV